MDFSLWRADADAVTALLVAASYIPARVAFPDEGMKFTKSDQSISFIFLEHNLQEQVVTPGRFADWPWPDGSFAQDRATLAGITCPVVGIAGLLDAKQNMPFHPYGIPLRDKDKADIARLQQLLAQSRDA